MFRGLSQLARHSVDLTTRTHINLSLSINPKNTPYTHDEHAGAVERGGENGAVVRSIRRRARCDAVVDRPTLPNTDGIGGVVVLMCK